MSQGLREEDPARRTFWAVFLVAGALILFQVSFTRLISYKLFYHFVFLAISLSLLGLGAAGTFVALRSRPARLEQRVHFWLTGLALSVPIAFLLIANPFGITQHPPIGTKLVGVDAIAYLLWCSPLMVWLNFCGGIVLTSIFSHHSQRMGSLYAADLLGAGAGSLACVALMKYGSPPLAFVSAVVLIAAAAAPFQLALPRGDRHRVAGGVALALGVGLSAVIFLGPSWLRDFQNFRTLGGDLPKIIKYEWNHIIRTDHVPGYYILDGQAATPIASRESVKRWRGGISTPVYVVAPRRPSVAIIGVGGGLQLAEALDADAREILAIDINPTILDWVQNEDRMLNWDLFMDPRVDVRLGEGRHVVRSAGRSFDVLVIHATDTYAAAVSGAYALSENFLYTKEALQDYFGVLTDDGVLAISRWLFHPPRENLRLFSTALTALEELGVQEPRNHLVMVAPVSSYEKLEDERVWGYFLMSKRPFTTEAIARLRKHVDRIGWSILYAPDRTRDNPFDELVRARDRSEFQAYYPYRVSPVTDSSPYLFLLYNPLDRTAYASSDDRVMVHLYQWSSIALPVSLVAVTVLTFLLILGPLYWSRRRSARGADQVPFELRHGVFFVGLGLGYMALEVPVIQIFSLYLGHPTYGFSVVLVALLVSTGLGSLWVERLTLRPRTACAWVAGVLAVVAIGVFPLVHGTLDLPDPARFAIALAVVAICGVPMGFPLALGVREIGRRDRRSVAWAWALNAAASVVGACAVMIAMVFQGSHAALIGSVLCYLVAAGAASRWSGGAQPVPLLAER